MPILQTILRGVPITCTVMRLSLDEETAERINEIQEQTRFDDRSELVRTAVEALHRETSTIADLENQVNALVVVRHSHEKDSAVSDAAHQFEDIIHTQLHSNLKNGNCLEVFHVDGDADTIKRFYRTLESGDSTDTVNLLPQNT